MKKTAITLYLLILPLTTFAQRFQVDTLAWSGPADKRINMVFLSDGYLDSQLDKFITDAKWMMNALLAKSPYLKYKSYFNCLAIRVPSEAEGAANDPDTLINNYFGSTFNYAGIWRLVVPVRSNRVMQVLQDNFPEYDQAVMVVNDTRYGGSGGWIATSTIHTSGPEICIHEIGHSFGGLSDEYWAGPQYARENINMTAEKDPEKVRWKRWLGFSSTGIYPHEESPEWCRPHQNCEMRYLNSTFCPVCREAIASRILDLTNPILEYSPAESLVSVGQDTSFRVRLLNPQPNTLRSWWELNRSEIAFMKDSVRLSASMLQSGENTLSFCTVDTTSIIRDPGHISKHLYQVNWNIRKVSTGMQWTADEVHLVIDVYPNPASDLLKIGLRGNSEGRSGDLRIRLIGMNGQDMVRPRRVPAEAVRDGRLVEIPLRVPSGTYTLLAETGTASLRVPVVVVR